MNLKKNRSKIQQKSFKVILKLLFKKFKYLKNERKVLKRNMEFTQNKLAERVNNVEENMFKVKET